MDEYKRDDNIAMAEHKRDADVTMDEHKRFLNALFRPNEPIYCCGPHPANVVYRGPASALLQPSAYICLNPVPGAWYAHDIVTLRNFLIEFDNSPLDQQHLMVAALEKLIPIRTVTYSGTKSLHAVVSLADDFGVAHRPGAERAAFYSNTAKALQAFALNALQGFPQPISGNLIDKSTKNANRLTRFAGGTNVPYKLGDVRRPAHQPLISVGKLVTVEQLTTLIAPFAVKPLPQRAIEPIYAGTLSNTLNNQTHLRPLWRFFNIPENWAGPHGNYPHLFKYTLWAIDATGVQHDEMAAYVLHHTCPFLRSIGYEDSRALAAIKNAFIWKKFMV